MGRFVPWPIVASNRLPQRIDEPAAAIGQLGARLEAALSCENLDLGQIVLVRALDANPFPGLEGEAAAQRGDRHALRLAADEPAFHAAPAEVIRRTVIESAAVERAAQLVIDPI